MSEVPLYGFAGLVLDVAVKQGTLSDNELEVGGWRLGYHTVAYAPFIKSQLASTQLTSGPYAEQIWARNAPELRGMKPS